ncbi:PCI domain-containing protein, putative [Plasmodium vivax]|uniref:PCI domain-containing protein n=5 Tax=Plasmodium vivax TaxID=5855 RepID=A5KBK2_PLAVS|nr:hypothetical protein, conserved [Plasmodium vivax]KMZ82170.1 hypothetical protein PVIIG_04912 [Plasmodium vivax India VII]KMZ88269.1 hypothetical protein PVBG_05133 [Plasmodium vivax Brazil I]KMZ94834.1 hypothetical protein PVMG_02723 [Plasmodium vivax Mauritania I]EDL43252.1 hypothetical protein, conserved [Plasmodium vivax]CAI7718562.1 PCI domain-containing protein, putative [Plasmodium vivax]|eukprot:XP_001612979.1 hypothetical protein [Plasmodium vivax Sal-1]
MNPPDEHAITRKINLLRRQRQAEPPRRERSYEDLLQEMETCVRMRNGYQVSSILKLTQLPVDILSFDETTEIELRKKIKKKNALKNYEQIIIDHYNIIKTLCNRNAINWDVLLNIGCKFLSSFIHLYSENLWLLPYLLTICSFLNNISTLADSYYNTSSKNDIYNEENEDVNEKNKYTIEVLNSIRGKIGIVKGDIEKHGGFIILMFQSIKLCMKLNNMQITTSFLKIINSTDIEYSYIPKSFIVLFKYQLGKLYLHKMEYEKAEREFIWAFANSRKGKTDFKKKLLESIISIRLNKGLYPPKRLLQDYELTIYIDIIHSIKQGNIFLYNRVMGRHSKYFFDNGLNECIDQIHFVVKRNLLKIAVDWWNETIKGNPNKLYKVPICIFHHIFNWARITQHHHQLETLCIITSLILFKYINAYIAYDSNILVLSKNDPFPSLSKSRLGALGGER